MSESPPASPPSGRAGDSFSRRISGAIRDLPTRAVRVGRTVRRRPGDAIFGVLVGLAAVFLAVVLLALLFILIPGSSFSLSHYGLPFLWSSTWRPSATNPYGGTFGALGFIAGTMYTSAIALLIAVPISLGIAIFIAELVPVRVRVLLTSFIDLLAAVPSVIFGFWGIVVLKPYMETTVQPTLGAWFPNSLIVQKPYDGYGVLTAGVILAIMIIPTISALSREALMAVPSAQREAALGLGATRWESTRVGVLKYARSGIVGAVVLGLGRAVGETMAVTMTIGNLQTGMPACLTCSGQSMASEIANNYPDSNLVGIADHSALIEVALILLVVALFINVIARLIISRLVTTSGESEEASTGRIGRLRKRLHLARRTRALLEGTAPTSVQFSSRRDSLRRWKNHLMLCLTAVCVVMAGYPLLSIIYTAWVNGHVALSWYFLTGPENPSACLLGGSGCLSAQQIGGIGPAITGTLILMAMAAAWAIPVSILAAIYLSEYGRGKIGRSLSFAMDVMSGVPSIVIGLFVVTYFDLYEPSYIQSTWSQAIALGVIMLPIVTRTGEEALKLVPHTLREAAWGLGVPQHKTVTRVVLRNGLGPLLTGCLLAVARAGGETAPLLFLGFNRFSPFFHCQNGAVSCLNNAAGPLGPFIYSYLYLPGSNNVTAAWGAALIFILMMLGLSLGARLALRGRLMVTMGGG